MGSKKNAGVIAATVAAVAVAGVAVGGGGGYSAFLGYINGRGRPPRVALTDRIGVGLFRGTGHGQDGEPLVEDEKTDPFTGRVFDADAVFGFGQDSFLADLPRATADHFGVSAFDSLSQIRGKSFDVLICHSDGCTVAITELEAGHIHAKTLLALGANWAYRDAPQGSFGGARVIFFQVDGAPVPAVLGRLVPRLLREGDPPGVAFGFRFGSGGPDVVHLANPSQKNPHSLATYFAAISEWMKGGGALQDVLRALFAEADRDDHEVKIERDKQDKDRRKKLRPGDAGGNSGCGQDCGGGEGGGGGGARGCPPDCDDGGGPNGPGGPEGPDEGGGGGWPTISHKDNGGVDTTVTIKESDIRRRP